MTDAIAGSLVYGLWREETFAVLGDAWATQALVEIKQWQSAMTNAEALALAKSDLVFPAPFHPEDIEEEFDLDAPFQLEEHGAVCDGDWPGMPAQWSVDFIPEEWGIGEQIETVFSGPYLVITEAEELELLRLAQESGIAIRRADELINDLAG